MRSLKSYYSSCHLNTCMLYAVQMRKHQAPTHPRSLPSLSVGKRTWRARGKYSCSCFSVALNGTLRTNMIQPGPSSFSENKRWNDISRRSYDYGISPTKLVRKNLLLTRMLHISKSSCYNASGSFKLHTALNDVTYDHLTARGRNVCLLIVDHRPAVL